MFFSQTWLMEPVDFQVHQISFFSIEFFWTMFRKWDLYRRCQKRDPNPSYCRCWRLFTLRALLDLLLGVLLAEKGQKMPQAFFLIGELYFWKIPMRHQQNYDVIPWDRFLLKPPVNLLLRQAPVVQSLRSGDESICFSWWDVTGGPPISRDGDSSQIILTLVSLKSRFWWLDQNFKDWTKDSINKTWTWIETWTERLKVFKFFL